MMLYAHYCLMKLVHCIPDLHFPPSDVRLWITDYRSRSDQRYDLTPN